MATPVAPPPRPPQTEVFEQGGWRFETTTSQLLSSERLDELSETVGALGTVPEMYFGDASVKFSHASSGTSFELTALGALQCCVWKPWPPAQTQPEALDGAVDGPLLGDIKCQFAKKWKPKTDNPDVKEIDPTSDWTCSTGYWGDCRSGGGATLQQATEDGLPMDLLRQRDEILWYQEVTFWEDELADNGLCKLMARIRVMPSFWFVLLTCEVRVDNVLLRDVGTRFFCSFGGNHILREWTWRQETYEALTQRGVQIVDNPQISGASVGTTLLGEQDVRRRLRHKLMFLQSAAASDDARAGEDDDLPPPPPAPPIGREET